MEDYYDDFDCEIQCEEYYEEEDMGLDAYWESQYEVPEWFEA